MSHFTIGSRIRNREHYARDTLYRRDIRPAYPMSGGSTHFSDGTPVTWCNRYTYYVASQCGVWIEPSLNLHPKTKQPSIHWTSADSMVSNIESNISNMVYSRLQFKGCVEEAVREGEFVIAYTMATSKKSAHLAVVLPDYNVMLQGRGVTVANAGGLVGIMRINRAFGDDLYHSVQYVHIPYRVNMELTSFYDLGDDAYDYGQTIEGVTVYEPEYL